MGRGPNPPPPNVPTGKKEKKSSRTNLAFSHSKTSIYFNLLLVLQILCRYLSTYMYRKISKMYRQNSEKKTLLGAITPPPPPNLATQVPLTICQVHSRIIKKPPGSRWDAVKKDQDLVQKGQERTIHIKKSGYMFKTNCMLLVLEAELWQSPDNKCYVTD